ncbi:MAG TPA: efflux RND transporter periplasmic adaptor subunit [Xanthobacteraceae bacterium]|jgi:membrane fusion protein (multidrug efflux system)|nr:efflux RND transporter periplasmic adaptor subunit [Xanthobacteraceae bacterium]
MNCRRLAAASTIPAGALWLMIGCVAAQAQGAAPPPAVTVTPVVSRQITEAGDFVGRIVAIDKVDVVARVPGYIEERNFTEGQMVKKGDLLFRIEQDTYKAAVDQQTANVAKAKATETNADYQLQRGQELVKNNNIPQSTVDQRLADQQAAAADILQAQALLEQAKINLGYTEIHSPIDGRIGLAIYTVGNLVDPSSGRMATIVSQDPIYVTFPVSEADIISYKSRVAASPDKNPHVTVHIKLPDGTIYPRAGVTNFLDVQVDPNTDTVLVRATFPNPDTILTPGGIVGVITDRATPQPSLVVPQSAVLLDQAGRYVMVVDDAKKVEQRRITAGVETGPNIVVKDGLKEGELVIIDGLQKVHPGQVVAATTAAPTK